MSKEIDDTEVELAGAPLVIKKLEEENKRLKDKWNKGFGIGAFIASICWITVIVIILRTLV